MNRLAPNLFDRRFADFVALGRAKLPSLAPEWTDYNAHDPGITLMELLAWVAEAQLYSLARPRRDERAAYAALMGLTAHGTRPARGMIWPDSGDPKSPASMLSRAIVIERDTVIRTTRDQDPEFRPLHRVLWVPARIRALTTVLADGTLVDHTDANRRSTPPFRPFGEAAGPNDVLRLELFLERDAPLIPATRPDDAYLAIGVRSVAPRDEAGEPDANQRHSPLEVTLAAGMQRFPLRIVDDTSGGFMRSGSCVLDLSGVQAASNTIALEFRAPKGFDRAPRILRIEPNVIPVSQSTPIKREPHPALGLPDQSFDLDTPGLQFEPSTDPVLVEVVEGARSTEWKKCYRLEDCGPHDRVFELDLVAARLTFGNGVNGEMPPAGAVILVSYPVSGGAGGNIARNRKWVVAGFSGVFGTNLDPVAGGQAASGWLEQRRQARLLAQSGNALVSAADIEAAARALPALEVARAWVVPTQPRPIEPGTVTLIAMQARAGGEPATIPETPRWLEAIRRSLAPRMPLASRLVVEAPRYAEFSLRAVVEAEPGREPASVRTSVERQLRERLALVAANAGLPQRAFGAPVTRRDIAAWIQALPDVRRVSELTIRLANNRTVDDVKVARHGLPRIDFAQTTIEVVRAARGGSQ